MEKFSFVFLSVGVATTSFLFGNALLTVKGIEGATRSFIALLMRMFLTNFADSRYFHSGSTNKRYRRVKVSISTGIRGQEGGERAVRCE